ncbi:unnamed protein product [Cuscuta epithymum]|uniref:Uncharacterized protein n=1 Tax=Cuscuta epithymum TaxID=186058 RepID=A0AAV0D6A5_9ASTE|nr:unnamed protein product [Cuscuta epithymum]
MILHICTHIHTYKEVYSIMGGRRGGGGRPSWPAPLDRKSSIESEPPTLSGDQIQVAREAALCVMNNASVEEAARIFTEMRLNSRNSMDIMYVISLVHVGKCLCVQGLEAVVSCVHDDDYGGEKRTRTFIFDYRDDGEQKGHPRVHTPIASAHPFRDIATAPF